MSLADLSPEQRRQAVIRLSRVVLRTGVGEIRDELQENVVEMALFLGPEASSFDDIVRILKDELVVDFPRQVLRPVLSRLEQKNLVSVDGTYRLSTVRRKEMQEQVNDYTEAWQNVLEQLTPRQEMQCRRARTNRTNMARIHLITFHRSCAHIGTVHYGTSCDRVTAQVRVRINTEIEGDAARELLEHSCIHILSRPVRPRHPSFLEE